MGWNDVGPCAGSKGGDFLTLAQNRYSCRSFSAQPVEPEKLACILEAGRLAPTACNKQPVRVWALQSPEALARMEKVRGLFGAPLVLMVGYRPADAWVRRFDGKNGAEVDAAIVTTHLMLSASDLGLGSVWVGSFDPAALRKAFPETDGHEILALLPIGYPAPGAAPGPLHAERVSPEAFAVIL